MDTTYGNPLPCPVLTDERRALSTRIEIARFVERIHRECGALRIATLYAAIVDELLDHLAEIDVRVESALMDFEEALVP